MNNTATQFYTIFLKGSKGYMDVIIDNCYFANNSLQSISYKPDAKCGSSASPITVRNSMLCNENSPFGGAVLTTNITERNVSQSDVDYDRVYDICDICPYDPKIYLKFNEMQQCKGYINATNSYGECSPIGYVGIPTICMVYTFDSDGNEAYEPASDGIATSDIFDSDGSSLSFTIEPVIGKPQYILSFSPQLVSILHCCYF